LVRRPSVRDCRAVLARVKATRFAGALTRGLDPCCALRSLEVGRGGETAFSAEQRNGGLGCGLERVWVLLARKAWMPAFAGMTGLDGLVAENARPYPL